MSAANEIGGNTDTGTSLIMIESSIARAYYIQVPEAHLNHQAGGYVFPCSSTLPSFTVSLGNSYKAVVPGEYINFSPLQEGSELCFGGIQENEGLPFSILGDVFLKSQYVVFDSRGPRIGFAEQT